MPYEVNIRVLLINNMLLVSVYQAKLAIWKLCSPKAAPQDILSDVHLKWVEAGSDQEAHMLSSEAALFASHEQERHTLQPSRPSDAQSECVTIYVRRSDGIAARLRFPFSKEKIFSSEIVRWMLRMLHNPYYEVCLVVIPTVTVSVHVSIVWYGYEQRLGTLANVLSIVMLAAAMPAAFLAALTLQVPILVRSVNFNFFFNLYNVVTFAICHFVCFRGSVWTKVYVSLLVVVFHGVFFGFVHAVQLRRWLLLVIQIFLCCAQPCHTRACYTRMLTPDLLLLCRLLRDASHGGDGWARRRLRERAHRPGLPTVYHLGHDANGQRVFPRLRLHVQTVGVYVVLADERAARPSNQNVSRMGRGRV
jgi:hypothetical protein